MIQKFIIPQKIKIDPNSTPKPQTINLDLKPYNKRNKKPYNKNPYNNPHNIHQHVSIPYLVFQKLLPLQIPLSNYKQMVTSLLVILQFTDT